MNRVRIRFRRGLSQAVKDMALELERYYGIRPLEDGERRPDGYYTPHHYTARGLRPVDQVRDSSSG